MSSTKRRACGLTNFSSAVRRRQCQYPLFGQAARAGGAQGSQRKPSRRWMLNATIVSAVLAVVLLFAIYFLTLIFTLQDTEQMRQGWSDFTRSS